MSQHQAKTIPINYHNSQFSDPNNVCIACAFSSSQDHLILWLFVPYHSGSMQNICFQITDMQYYDECRCFQLWLLLPMCYSLLTTDCVVSSWRRSVRAWRVCSTASCCPRGSRCRPRHVMFVVRLLCPGWPRTCRTRQTSRWWTARTRWGTHWSI